MKTTLLIHPNELRAVSLFVSKDPARFVITGILIERANGVTAITACDGRRLLSLDISLSACASGDIRAIIPIHLVKAMPKTADKKTRILVEIDESEVSFTGEWTMKSKLIAGNYPNWKQVIPKGEPLASNKFDLNMSLLSDFGIANKRLGERMMRFFQCQEQGAFQVLRENDPMFFGVIMPMAARDALYRIPNHAK